MRQITQKYREKIWRFLRTPITARTISYMVVILYLSVYLVSGLHNFDKLHQTLSFSTSSGVFWLLIIFIMLCHLDFFRDIVKDIVRSKVSEFATTEYYKKAVSQLLDDNNFRSGVADIAVDPSNRPQNEFIEKSEAYKSSVDDSKEEEKNE